MSYDDEMSLEERETARASARQELLDYAKLAEQVGPPLTSSLPACRGTHFFFIYCLLLPLNNDYHNILVCKLAKLYYLTCFGFR